MSSTIDIAAIPLNRIPALIAALAARLLAEPQEPATALTPETSGSDDIWLSAAEVAAELGCSVKFVYRHAKQWPFAKRLGTRSYRFSQSGLRRWRTRQKA
jgi:predicted DNA-binding transcriptional regulator AlpA